MRRMALAFCALSVLAIAFWSASSSNAQLGDGEPVKGEKIITPAGTLIDIGSNRFGFREFKRVVDGATMVLVPSSDFPKRDYIGDPLEEQSSAMLHVDSFLIDKFETTNAQVAAFLKAQKDLKYSEGQIMGPNEKLWAKSHAWGLEIKPDGATVRAGFENFPSVGGTGYMAVAYAKWAGADLPYGFEFEKAAAGVTGLEFPWGNDFPDSTRANSFLSGPKRTAAVGSYAGGTSPYGLLDMAGNVYERAYWVEKPSEIQPNMLPVMLKGGAWVSAHWANLRCVDRCAQPMGAAEGSVGFRTVIRDPAVMKALAIDTQAKLLVFDETEKAFVEAAKRNVPIFLFLGHETCGQTDRVRAEVFNDPKFIEFCNERAVVLIGHNPGDGWQDPVPAGADGASLLIPGCKHANISQVFDDFVRAVDVRLIPMQIREFKVSPGMFALNPHRDLIEEPDNLVLIGEDAFPKSGAFVEEFLKQLEAAQKALGEGQTRTDYLAGKAAPKTSWKVPPAKDE